MSDAYDPMTEAPAECDIHLQTRVLMTAGVDAACCEDRLRADDGNIIIRIE